MSINNVVDKAYCINLAHREDRWARVSEQFEKNNIAVERFEAFNGNEFNDFPLIRRGEAGCLKSHLDVMSDALSNDYDCIAVFEDDVFFVDNFENLFDYIYDQVPDDWQFLYLGCNSYTGTFQYVSNNVKKIQKTYSAHAFMIKSIAMELVLNTAILGEKPIDVYYGDVQEMVPAYATIPTLAGQTPDFSDINNEYVDYNWIYKLDLS